MREKLVPVVEWANRHGVSRTTVMLKIQSGELRGRRLGRYWYVVEEVEESPASGVILTFFNHAGGVGKTTLVRDLGFELFRRGHRVLLVDVDPQANLTRWLGVEEVKPEQTLFVLAEGPLPKPLKAQGMDLIPSSLALAELDVCLRSIPAGELLLRRELEPLREVYDFILVDAPPSLSPLSFLAGLAGDGFVVPVEASPKGIQGVDGVIRAARNYARVAGLRGSGFVRLIVPTKYAPQSGASKRALEGIQALKEYFPVSEPLRERPGLYRKATEESLPVHLVDEEGQGVAEVATVADTLLRALGVAEEKEVVR